MFVCLTHLTNCCIALWALLSSSILIIILKMKHSLQSSNLDYHKNLEYLYREPFDLCVNSKSFTVHFFKICHESPCTNSNRNCRNVFKTVLILLYGTYWEYIKCMYLTGSDVYIIITIYRWFSRFSIICITWDFLYDINGTCRP